MKFQNLKGDTTTQLNNKANCEIRSLLVTSMIMLYNDLINVEL